MGICSTEQYKNQINNTVFCKEVLSRRELQKTNTHRGVQKYNTGVFHEEVAIFESIYRTIWNTLQLYYIHM